MNYATNHAFTPKELFDNCNLKELNIPKKIFTDKYKADTLREFCGQVLAYCFYLIILDIIENNITFVLPLVAGRNAYIYAKPFEGELFQKMYQGGCFRGIDFLLSNFTGYQLVMHYKSKNEDREKQIYISNNLKDKFYERINNGQKYY